MSKIKFKNNKASAAWIKHVEVNNDEPYGKACVDAAREVMEWIDENNPETLDMEKINKVVLYGKGLTGFMVGCISSMIVQCHVRGEEYRQAWNADYGIEAGSDQDTGGTVNPAIVTLSTKEE